MKTILLILLLSISLYAQTFCLITGKVKDEYGQPIKGALVSVYSRGCYNGATYSNQFGYYKLYMNTDCGYVRVQVKSKYKYNWQPGYYEIWFPYPTTQSFSDFYFTGYYSQW
jgi:hypothetical protein